jgi:hypothetical protein
VHGIRVTLGPRASRDDSFVELLCAGHGGDVSCPPSSVPREQGLLLAMMMEVPLVKAWEDDVPALQVQPAREEHPESSPRRSASTPGKP